MPYLYFKNSYPYFIDRYDINYADICYPGMEFLSYSFWRIDAFKLKHGDWFIKPNMEQYYLVYCNKKKCKTNKLCLHIKHYSKLRFKIIYARCRTL